MSEQKIDQYRRDFFSKTTAAAATGAIAPGVMLMQVGQAQARPLDEAVSNKNRWGLLVDSNKCADGCSDCVKACESENAWGSGSTDEQKSDASQKAQWIRTVTLKNKLTGSEHQLPMMCQHCEKPPCVDVCPTGASFKRADGCSDCVKACESENAWGSGSSDEQKSDAAQKAQWIRTVTLKNKLTGSEHQLPMMCQHCEKPPCVDVCPTGASFKRADGIVLVDKHICIGCRYCMMACPYKARSFIHENLHDQAPDVPRGKGTVESCTLCVHKIDRGDGTTACAEACTHQAILFGDLNDPTSKISIEMKKHATTQIRADLELNTGVRYRGI